MSSNAASKVLVPLLATPVMREGMDRTEDRMKVKFGRLDNSCSASEDPEEEESSVPIDAVDEANDEGG